MNKSNNAKRGKNNERKSQFENELIDNSDLVSFYTDFPMTHFENKDEKGNIKPLVSDENVSICKEFVDGNHK